MRLGARGKWVKSGAEWAVLAQPARRPGFHLDDLDPVLDLLAALQTHDAYWRHDVGAPGLASFGHRLIPLLQRAATAGVPLLAGNELCEVRLRPEPGIVEGDLTRADAVRLSLGVRLGETLVSGAAIVPIGSPAHAVGLLIDGSLTLATASPPIPTSLQRLLVADGEVVVPTSDAELLDDYLRPLSRMVRIGSSDGSVAVPEPIRPRLRLTVTWESSTDARLAWSWRYADSQCPLDAADWLDGLRDRTVEQEIRDRVPDELLRRRHATGGDALTLAIHDLPALRHLDDVEVVEEERPEFRESAARTRNQLRPGSDNTVRGEETHTDWLDLEVTITVEGERIPLPRRARGADPRRGAPGAAQRPLPAHRPPGARAAPRRGPAAGELREVEGDRIGVGRHDLGLWAQLAELGVVDAQAAEWVRRAQALRDLTELPRPEPTGLATELRPYQRDGFHWLAFLWEHELGGILADDMGLGKTLQVLALIAHALGCGDTRPVPRRRTDQRRDRLAVRGGPSRAGPAGPHGDPPGRRRRRARRRGRRGRHDVRPDPAGRGSLRRRGLGRARPRRGAAGQEPPQQDLRRGPPTRSAVPARGHRHAVREPADGAVVAALDRDAGLYPWPRGSPSRSRDPVEKRRRRGGARRFRQRIRPFCCVARRSSSPPTCRRSRSRSSQVELTPRHRKIYDTHLAKERQRILGLVEDFDQNRIAIFRALTKLRQLALDPALVDPAHDARRLGQARPAGRPPPRGHGRGAPGAGVQPVHVVPRPGRGPARAGRRSRPRTSTAARATGRRSSRSSAPATRRSS